MAKNHAALEDVSVISGVRGVRLRRVGSRSAEKHGQFADKTLRVGKLAAAGALPTGDEVFDGSGDGLKRCDHLSRIFLLYRVDHSVSSKVARIGLYQRLANFTDVLRFKLLFDFHRIAECQYGGIHVDILML